MSDLLTRELPARILKRVRKTDTCWLWTGPLRTQGYGACSLAGKAYQAHRVFYEAAKGPIPDGMVLDHLCRVRHCVNPDHLEVVTNRVNLLRGVGFPGKNSRKTHCSNGHEFSGDNVITVVRRDGVGRKCRACHIKQSWNYHERKRNERKAKP